MEFQKVTRYMYVRAYTYTSHGSGRSRVYVGMWWEGRVPRVGEFEERGIYWLKEVI